jgi:hypothetical protein
MDRLHTSLHGAVAVAKPRGAYAPRSWLYGVRSPREQRFLRYANASSQERRASARRGARDTLAGEMRTTALNKPDPERLVSARRGGRNTLASQPYQQAKTANKTRKPAVVGETRLQGRAAAISLRGASRQLDRDRDSDPAGCRSCAALGRSSMRFRPRSCRNFLVVP